MDPEVAGELLDYSSWANKRLLGAVAQLDSDQFMRALGGSFGSLQGTLTHMLWAEWLWLERWQGRSPMEVFSPATFPSVDSLEARWNQVQSAQEAFLSTLAPDQLQRVVRYTNRKGETWEYPLWRQIHHAFNHSTYHRGQLTHMLRALGVRPVSTDFLVFRDEEAGRGGR